MTLGFVSPVPLGLRPAMSRAALRPAQRSAPVAARRRARVLALAKDNPAPADDGAEDDAGKAAPAAQAADGANEEPELYDDSNGLETGADDILSSPAFLKKKLEIVQKELAEAKAAAELAEEAIEKEKNSYVRLAADFENFRRRSGNDLLAQDSKATAKVCKEILAVLDNFERAIAAVTPETDKEKSINSSYQAINKQLLDALVKLKVTPINALGEVFDPELHDAIQNAESDEYPEGVVCAQFQRGYVLGDTLIRAAMVAVSQGPGPAVEEGDDEVADDEDDTETPDDAVSSGKAL